MYPHHRVQQSKPSHLAQRTLIASLLAAWLGVAQAAAVNIDIPSQPLASALAKFAEQSGIKMTYPAELLAGKTAPRIEGKLSPQQALEKLLEGSGLRYEFVTSDAVKIEVIPVPPMSHEEMPTEMAPIEVRGAKVEKSYSKPSSTTAAKLDVPNRDVPQSIEVRPAEVLKDMGGPPRVDELLKTVSGVTKYAEGNNGSNYPRVMMRGFQNNYIARNGAQPKANYNAVVDMANVEQVEVLKGPSSVLYGSQTASSGMGGIVNIVTKRPTAEKTYGGDVTLGSWNFKRGTAYINGAANEAKTVLLRLDASMEKANSFQQYTDHDNQFIAPAATFNIGKNDMVTLLADQTISKMHGGSYIPKTALYAQVPIDAFLGNPATDFWNTTSWNSLAEYVHKFDSGWKLTFDASTNKTDTDGYRSSPALIGATTNVGLTPGYNTMWQKDNTYDLHLDGHLKTGQVDHYLLAGYTYTQNGGVSVGNTASTRNITLPLFGPYNYTATAPVWMGNLFGAGDAPYSSTYTYTNRAYYLQDMMSLGEKFKLMLGARQDDLYQVQMLNGWITNMLPPATLAQVLQPIVASHVSPRVGLVYQPTAETSVYGGYSTSFTPAGNTLSFTGQKFKPEEGKQIELGVKRDFSDRLNANVALYQLTRANVLANDSAHPGFSIQTGEQQSKGLEVDVNGQLTSALRLNFAYAHVFHAAVTNDTVLPIGTKLAGVPMNTVNLLGIYSFGGGLAGLELGGGINYAGEVQGSTPNTFIIGSTMQFDAVASYKLGKSSKVQLNLKNLTDHRNYYSSGSTISMGSPRAAYLNLRMDM